MLLLLGSLAAVAVQSGCSSSHQTQKKPPPVFGPPAVFHWGVHRHFPAGQWPTGKSVYCAGEGSSAGAKVPPPGHRVASSGGITIQTRGDGSIDIHCQPSAHSRQSRLGVRQGSFAAKFVVHPGDEPIEGNGERSELRASQAESGGYPGRNEWYGWSTLFPKGLNPTPGTSWNFFAQWHDSLNNGCGPNIVYAVDAAKSPAKIRLRVRGGPVSLSTCAARYDRSWYPVTLSTGHWYDFVLQVRWSADPRVGFVQAWIDGRLVVPKTKVATLYPRDGVYVKQGFYRKPSGSVSTLYQDGMRRGNSYARVSAP